MDPSTYVGIMLHSDQFRCQLGAPAPIASGAGRVATAAAASRVAAIGDHARRLIARGVALLRFLADGPPAPSLRTRS